MDDGHRSSRMENRAARIMHRGCKVPSTPSNTRNRILLDLDGFVSAYTHQSEAESGDARRVNVPRDDDGTPLFVSIIQALVTRGEKNALLSFFATKFFETSIRTSPLLSAKISLEIGWR